MIRPINYEYVIDMMSNNNFIQVPVIQGDSDKVRYVKLSFLSQGLRYTIPDDSTVYIVGQKPDGHSVIKECTVENNTVIFDISAQMSAVPGIGKYSIIFQKDEQVLSSFPFQLHTVKSADWTKIKSSDDMKALEEALEHANKNYDYVITEATQQAERAKQYADIASTFQADINEIQNNIQSTQQSAKNALTSATEAHNDLIAIQNNKQTIQQSEQNVLTNTNVVNQKTQQVQNLASSTQQVYSDTQKVYQQTQAKYDEISTATEQAKESIDQYASDLTHNLSEQIVPLATVTTTVDASTQSFVNEKQISLSNTVKVWFQILLTQIANLNNAIVTAIASIKVATTSNDGFMPKLSNNSNQYLNGKGQWTQPNINSLSGKLDATKINGTLPLANLPQGALDRQINVTNKTARLALTTDDVQNGDTVQEDDTELMYRVVDESMLGTNTPEKAFKEYTAGRATYATESGMVNGHTVDIDVPADAKFTDTNTWRGVVDNLTSTATDKSLTAKQGKVLKDEIDGMKETFQNGVEVIYNACETEGIKPSDSTPNAITQAIASIRKGGNAAKTQILKGKTAYVGKTLIEGTMENKGDVTLSTTGASGNVVLSTEVGYYTQITVNQTPAYNAGRTQGQTDVKNSPNTYGVYSKAQYDGNYTSGVNAGRSARENELYQPWYVNRYNDGVAAGQSAEHASLSSSCGSYIKKIISTATTLSNSGNTDTAKKGGQILSWISYIQEYLS